MGEITLLVSNVHSQLTEEHLRKIFAAAVGVAPKRIEVVARDEEWYSCRIYSLSNQVATQAKEALHGKVILERELHIEYESPEMKALIQKCYEEEDYRTNQLKMEAEYCKHQLEMEITKHLGEEKALQEKHQLETERITRTLELQKETITLREIECAKLEKELKSKTDTAIALKKAKELNGEAYQAMKKKLENTVDSLNVLKAALNTQITTLKNQQYQARPALESIVEIHKSISEIIAQSERQI